jgi:anti-sigma-K factor RskA
VNVQEYISSGIIQSYVMGLTNAEETAEFERMCELHPEVRAAREEFERALEEKALKNAVSPPAYLKSKIFSEIEIESQHDKSKLVPLTAAPENNSGRKLRTQQYLTAASFVLFLASAALAFYFSRQLQNTRQQYEVCLASESQIKAQLAVLQKERNTLKEDLAVITNEDMIQVKLPAKPSGPAPQSMVTVFWNKKTKAVFLVPNKIPKPASNKQYQLWALVNGKPQDAGVFDMQTNEWVITMKKTESAEAFAVSLEDRGPNASTPSGEIYVIGEIRS